MSTAGWQISDQVRMAALFDELVRLGHSAEQAELPQVEVFVMPS